jgi:hypothetical protein
VKEKLLYYISFEAGPIISINEFPSEKFEEYREEKLGGLLLNEVSSILTH